MRWWVLAVPLLVLAAGAAVSALPRAADAPAERAFTLEAVAFACDEEPDGVCLAYAGAVPGPTLDVRLGDTVQVTLVNRIAETLAALDADPALKARLAAANVSFHAHGTAVAPAMDGVPAHAGTQLASAVAEPGGAFVYRFRAAFAGPWHYHDHALGHDGSEGSARGLYGALVVRTGAESVPDARLDLHVADAGVNGGRGLDAIVAAGASFEILVAGLGNNVWTVTLEAPDGATVGSYLVGPGVSERFRVASAAPGAYRWTAAWAADFHEGTVTAV